MRLVDSWNAMLLGTPLKRLEMLEQLKKRYKVYLFSNTNATHIEWVYKDLLLTHGIANFNSQFFHKAYYSHLIGLRKPHAAAFEYVIHDSSMNPAETLFIDDNIDNIAGAESVGLNVHHHPVGHEIIDWVSEHL
jgi:putative hydrolase of the HAD superfamily